MALLLALLLLPSPALAQDPYRVAGEHYHLVFENPWVRATRVFYEPHSKAPVHDHPPTPTTVYVYVTDGGALRFQHITGDRVAGYTFTRSAVAAGAIRFAHGAPETHSSEYLGETPAEYARIELRTEPIDRPVRDVRLRPFSFAGRQAGLETQFENGQVRILRMRCGAAEDCPPSLNPQDPAVVVVMNGAHRGEIQWSPSKLSGPGEYVRIELKTGPVTNR